MTNYNRWIRLFNCLLFLSGLLTATPTFAQADQRISITSITPSINTGQDYSPWLSDDLNNMIDDSWQKSNFQYVDVTLKLQQHSKLSKLLLYDWQGTCEDNPAYVYALNGTKKTLLAKFTGSKYMVFDTVTLASAVEADAIVVHKYGNGFPQKLFIYGVPATTTGSTPVITLPTIPILTPTLVKIPVDGKRWYQLNSASDGLASMFDGNTATTVQPEYGKIFKNYDAYYPVLPGEQINLYKIKFYSNNADLGNYPVTLSVITQDGKRIIAGTFQGGKYNTWVGPYPNRQTTGDSQFMLDASFSNIKYIVLNCWYDFPPEIELYGTYTAPPSIAAASKKGFALKNYFGVNAFEWDFENPYDPSKVDETMLKPAKAFTQVRHYLDWERLEYTQRNYTFNPTQSGGWNYDALYQRFKTEGIEVLADIKTLPPWMQATYPDSLKDNEDVPVKYGKDFSDPNSYIEQAKVAFQFAARYGSNTLLSNTLITVSGVLRYLGAPVNISQKGMGVVKYIECDNERDKWWKGRKAYQTAWEYAANLSAFYDGNKNTMGPGVGVKNADPSMQVVMGGLAYANTDYIKGMVDWCRQHRGYKADGSVNLCWDVINYHFYANDDEKSQGGNPTRGVAPELSIAAATAQDFISVAHQYAADMPVWVTELGYDINQGSPLKAIPIGIKTALQTQADWALRSALLYARYGVERTFFYEMYDDNSNTAGQFSTSGLLNTDKTRRPVADFFYQANKLMGNYIYKETIGSDPLVDRYEFNGQSAYVLTIPDEKGRTATYSLSLSGADSARIYSPKAGTDNMDMQLVKLTNGKLNLTVTETPQFVVPFGSSNVLAAVKSTNLTDTSYTKNAPVNTKSTIMTPNANSLTDAGVPKFMVYPNPTVSYVNVSFDTPAQSKVEIRVSDASSGKIYHKTSSNASAGQFAQMVDMSSMPNGVYLVEVRQGNSVTVKKVVKTN